MGEQKMLAEIRQLRGNLSSAREELATRTAALNTAEAEVRELRAALEKIALGDFGKVRPYEDDNKHWEWANDIAREALKESKDG